MLPLLAQMLLQAQSTASGRKLTAVFSISQQEEVLQQPEQRLLCELGEQAGKTQHGIKNYMLGWQDCSERDQTAFLWGSSLKLQPGCF